jgi:hypothetical protein
MGDDLHIEIIQNVLERKDSMAECCQWVSERACVTSPFFGQGTTSFFFLAELSSSHHSLHEKLFRSQANRASKPSKSTSPNFILLA